MKIRDIMVTNVVTIPSSASITDAKRIMEAHRIGRLPVVDKGKLVGIVTARRLEQVSPSKATSLSVWEMAYLLDKTTVREIMEKEVITVSLDMNAEESLELAQAHKIGSLIVMEDNRIVGMATTNDFFYKLLNPILGLKMGGTRLEIHDAGDGKAIEKILSIMNRTGVKLNNIHVEGPIDDIRDLCIHVDTTDAKQLIAELEANKFKVAVR